MSLLKIKNLHTYFKTENSLIKAVKGVTFEIKEQETLGIIGDSGSGKSQIALSILKLFQKNQNIYNGQIIFQNKVISDLDEKEIRKIRGNKISMIFQDPSSSLNPVLKIKDQITEVLILHRKMSKESSLQESFNILKKVEITDPKRVLESYPFQLSGGMCQRVMIAIALSCSPKLLIADEPTTAIDVLAQKEILNLIKKIQKKNKMAMLFITHDLSIISSLVKNVIVLYKGQIIEKAPYNLILNNPIHPYTKRLINDFLITSINSINYVEKNNFFENENNLFNFNLFKTQSEPDLDFIEVEKEHFIRCNLLTKKSKSFFK
ncbi:MAG: ABC-type peptide/nickel transport system ATP-binding protein [Candidatus Phytoplasma cynodontis]|uniref:ABC transporter ATP-binding protein n=1 Tax='Cynodon dactylon' phytoplasma TaxID=295320 RepID=UPI001265C298|nr:ABC transporter ATP-binding protein ['Cynodon dactylon' phytoplasma]KAB8121728.1 ABC transporter ATP-binding protein ['Cynodon dactylon' phytoplasma]WIA07688.1 MAG: ABC-type peptide/nickel transport system ATP-binding protein [Candidatus Phytoplasma cynodontis]